MRLCIWPLAQQPWSSVLETAAHADVTGWDGVYVADHFMGDGVQFGAEDGPTWEATATVAALAAVTERVRVGTLVLSATYRHPAVVAKWAGTVDHLSSGRLTLGLGAGWQRNEHEQYGIELPSPGDRVRLLDETCAAITGLLRDERTSVTGRFVTLTDAVAEPKPVQPRLPLLVGAKGDRMLGVVARHADVWNTWALPDALRARSTVLDERCEALGRDPAGVQRSVQALVKLTDDRSEARAFVERSAPRAAFAGPATAFADLVGDWGAAGVAEVVVPDLHLGAGPARRQAMDELLTAVRAATDG
ncbi:LLM class flavin-dependent oxidoreductase [Rhabdothermincola salaria]|uniref:LLM class flavin-dependent oxidoreductase n=1 Tax=Rhabdothermincola salaria TaxID=2903142 RepID=UPI001E4708EC|nr:LLM class flavin-dependent oxidoreductase [Rhabdothermincola salaria]MCD9624769.1 LLM class flavin-dependent oxidoreductase [Rhabdothermincola salaria]